MTTASTIRRRYVTAPIAGKAIGKGAEAGRLVHYRVCGEGPAVVMLHDSPRSSRLHTATMKMLASRFRVFALDTPGYGNSQPLGLIDPAIPDFAEALREALAALGLEEAPLYATHTSAKIALALAARGGKMPLLVLDGLSIPDAPAPETFINAYMRPFRPDADGAYLAAEWVHARDMLRWFPWFSRKAESRMAMDAPAPEWLEDYGIDLFSAGPHYSDAYAAAMRWNPLEDLRTVQVPTRVAARSDDVLYGFLGKVPVDQNDRLTVERLGSDRDEWLDWLAETLAGAGAGAGAASPPPPEAAPDAQAGYVDLPQGQLHWRRNLSGSGRKVLALSAPTTLEAQAWAQALAGSRPTLVPDLPGFGDSDPLAKPDADLLANSLAQVIEHLALGKVDVLAIGLAAPLGARLAALRPDLVETLVIHGAPHMDIDAAFNAACCPVIPFDAHAGTHLHRIWHMLRDSQVQWPWFDGTQGAARKSAALPEQAQMHAALTGVLKQLPRYGDCVAAALTAASAEKWREVTVPTFVTLGDDPAQREAKEIAGLLRDGQTFALPASPQEGAAILTAMLGAAVPAAS